jgi:hypothetical protein
MPGTATAARAGSNKLELQKKRIERIERIERRKKTARLDAQRRFLCAWIAVFAWLATEATSRENARIALIRFVG